jgi:hypothetical protein
LKERGWTYKQVVDDLRRQLALRYVKDPRLRLSQWALGCPAGRRPPISRTAARPVPAGPTSSQTRRRP